MQDALDSLVSLLDLEDLEVNIFRGNSPPSGSQRVFGGQVLGQALVAAGRTVEKGIAHSIHASCPDSAAPISARKERMSSASRRYLTRRSRSSRSQSLYA